MKIYFESTVECTIDGVGLLEPGKPVEVDPDVFQVFHNVSPIKANLPRTIKVTVDTEREEDAEKTSSVEEEGVR